MTNVYDVFMISRVLLSHYKSLEGYSFNLDQVHEVVEKFRNARDYILGKYGEKVDFSIWVYFFPSGEYPVIATTIIGRESGSLEGALREYVSLVGAPTYVKGGSDYRIVERVLNPLGLILRRPILESNRLKMGKKVITQGSLHPLV